MMNRRLLIVSLWLALLPVDAAEVEPSLAATRAEHAAQSLVEPLFGRPASAVGVTSTLPDGVAVLSSRLLVRWQTIGRDHQIVTGVAVSWSPEDRERFRASGESVHALASAFARRWGPADAQYVSESRLGVGATAIFAFRSERVRAALGPASHVRTEAGDLYVVVVLDSDEQSVDLPITADAFEGHPHPERAMFTLALIAERPWGRWGS